MADPIFAVVTPFDSTHAGAIDEAALRDLLDFLAAGGVHRIVANGTTGEFPALSQAERRRVLEICRAGFSGEVIAHVSSPCADEVREALAHARDYADAALLLPPYYFAAPPAAGVRAYLTSLARATPLALYLYNFPRHTQVPLTLELIQLVAGEAENIRGLKDSSGDLLQALAIKDQMPPSFEVYLGADALALEALARGLDGSVTGGAQPVPEFLVALANEQRAGNAEAANEAQARLDHWSALRKQVPLAEPAALKAALGARLPGFPTAVRPPFVAADEAQTEQLRAALCACCP